MNKKSKLEWSKIDGASSKPKWLHLEKDERNTLYHCPIQVCDHEGFQSQRGCRKHVSTKNSWFYYFDEKPDLSSFKDTLQVPVNKLPLTTTDDCTSSQTARTCISCIFSFGTNWPRVHALSG